MASILFPIETLRGFARGVGLAYFYCHLHHLFSFERKKKVPTRQQPELSIGSSRLAIEKGIHRKTLNAMKWSSKVVELVQPLVALAVVDRQLS